MLGISQRALRTAWSYFLVFAVLAFIFYARETVLVFLASIIFAYIFWPAVHFLERKSPPWLSRTLALSIVYLVVIGGVLVFFIFVGTNILDQITAFLDRLPQLLKNESWIRNLPVPTWLAPFRDKLIDWLRSELSSGAGNISQYFHGFGSFAKNTLTSVLYIVLIPIFAFYFIKDGQQIKDYVVNSFTPRKADLIESILDDVHLLIGHYIRALVILSIITICLYSLVFTVAGVPYAIPLAAQASVLEWIPVIGPLTAGIVMILVAGFAGYPHLIFIILFWIFHRGLQDYVISPWLMGTGVEVHPLVVLFAVLAGEQLAGVPGMFFAVPVVAVLRVIVVQATRASERKRLEPAEEEIET